MRPFYFVFLLPSLISLKLRAQSIPISEIMNTNDIRILESNLAQQGFHYHSTDTSYRSREYMYVKKLERKDSVIFKINFNDSLGIITKAYFFENTILYKNFSNFLKKNGFVLRRKLGGKFNGYIEEYINTRKEKFTLYKNYKEDLKSFSYRVYFP